MLVDGQREQIDGDDDGDGREVGREGERLLHDLRDAVQVIAVLVREDHRNPGDQRIAHHQDQRQPVGTSEDRGGGRLDLRHDDEVRLAHRFKTTCRTLSWADISTLSSNGSKRVSPRLCNARSSSRSAKCGFFGSSEPCR